MKLIDCTKKMPPVPEIAHVKAVIKRNCLWMLLAVCAASRFAFSSKSCMGRIFGNEIDENSVIMSLNLFYTKIDFMSLCVKASNVGILKLGVCKELLCRHLSCEEK